jgi:hypothetical protein
MHVEVDRLRPSKSEHDGPFQMHHLLSVYYSRRDGTDVDIGEGGQ